MIDMKKMYLDMPMIAKEAAQIVREMFIGTKFEDWNVKENPFVHSQPTVMAIDVDQTTPCRVETEWRSEPYKFRFYGHFNFAFDLREISEFYGKNTPRWIRFIERRCMDASANIQEVPLFYVSSYIVDASDVQKGMSA